ncbi:cytochrome P450 20A1 isoform X6 [Sagmatias obliquidens]|uniref:cytochrome P450 20A1 isoform X6 n=1 Tax=Sagmatias obliquidens TaxID=3371155 RepID=UPI000F43FA07|nr:cytochrome P450 20A1 isoform X6 [Lagenorhynchus obliquidens]
MITPNVFSKPGFLLPQQLDPGVVGVSGVSGVPGVASAGIPPRGAAPISQSSSALPCSPRQPWRPRPRPQRPIRSLVPRAPPHTPPLRGSQPAEALLPSVEPKRGCLAEEPCWTSRSSPLPSCWRWWEPCSTSIRLPDKLQEFQGLLQQKKKMLSEELLDKWLSYPESQHVPLCQHMLGFAMKSVTQMVMGSTFEDEQEVIRFQKNHGTVWSEIGKGFLDGSLDKSTTRKKQYEDDPRRQYDIFSGQLHNNCKMYCRQVLCETVRTARLTPVSARLQDMEGKIDKFIIPRETLVLYALGVVLQDPSTWPSPYKFDPERFDDESVMKTFSLLGFSGTQECPELRFAYMVTTVLLSVLVRRLHLLSVEGQVIETKYELVTSSKEEAWITVSKRY